MAKGNVILNKQQGAGQAITGKDHYNGWLMYVAQSEYPTGIMQPYAAAAFAVGDILEYTDHKIYRVLTTNALTGTPATDVGAGDVVEVTDVQELADARTALVTIANMDSLGIVENSNAHKIWFQANLFFEKFPNGYFWLRPADKALGTSTFDEADDLVTVTNGDVRKIGVYNNGNDANFAAGQVTALQAKYAEYNTGFTPCSFAYFPIKYAETYDNFIDLKDSGNNFGVSVYNLYDYKRMAAESTLANKGDYPAMGVLMAYWARSPISDNVGWVEKYDFTSAPVGSNSYAEFDSIGVLDSAGEVSYATLKGGAEDLLDDKGWNILVKYVGQSGSFVNDMYTVSADGNDFEIAPYVQTLDKLARNIRTALLPKVQATVKFNSDGTLRDTDVHIFTNLAKQAVEAMERDGDLTQPVDSVVIDRTQDVATTRKLYITVNVILNGYAKTIIVDLSRVKS